MVNFTPKPIIVSNDGILAKLKAANTMPSHITRFALGAGALSIEPFVDYYSNRKLDPETRKYSVTKTLLKILVGTTTGVLSRSLAAGKGRKYLLTALNNKEQHKQLLKYVGKSNLEDPAKIKKLADAFGDTVGICSTALFTVFCDVPVINRLMNKTMKKLFPQQASSPSNSVGKESKNA